MLNQFTASLWGDEAFSAILSQKSILQIISIISRDTSPPLYNITEHLWFRVFGSSEVAIRALSFLYFLIAIIFVYKIARHFFGEKTAIIAALLTFLNPFFFTYAFEGRMYSILAATVTASFYFLITKNWKFYIIATALALYSHHFAFFALFIQIFIFLFLLKIGNLKLKIITAIKVFGLIALLYLPWIIPLYNQLNLVGSGFWLGIPTISDFLGLIGKYLATGIEHPFAKPALLITLILLLIRKWNKNVNKSLFLILWFAGPILLAFIISQKFTSVFFDRYLLFMIPSAMILIASNKRQVSLILIGVLAIIFAVIDFNYFTHPTKRPFRDLANYVLETKRGDDYLINWNGGAHHLWESKYYKIDTPIYLPDAKTLPYFVGTALMEPSDLTSTIPKKVYRIGVITSDNVDSITIPAYTKKEVKTFGPASQGGELKFIWFAK